MNSTLLKLDRPFTGSVLKSGVPFSTRLGFGVRAGRTPASLSNRDFVHAWIVRRAARLIKPVHPVQ
jgi:hypothetical protein